jgi:phenylacetate-coenzyme A ligase PaaK-like adenylate-forming protein
MSYLRRTFWNNLALPMGGLVNRQPVRKYLKYYDASQYWSPERLRETQARLLQQTLETAYRDVPLYRQLFEGVGAVPSDIRTLDDLHILPVTTKEMLKDVFPDGCTRKQPLPVEHQATSGSTGLPFQSIIDADSQARARALMFLRAMSCGYRPGDAVVQIGPSPQRAGLKSLKDGLLGITYVSSRDMTDATIDHYLEIMDRKRIPYLMGTGQNMFLMALRAIERGFNHRLKAAVSWGSLLLPEHRTAIEKAFGCGTWDTYGVSEGMQVAAQCGEAHGGYHQFCLHVGVEFCRDGKPVPPGEEGELLLTRLNPGAMPFIRYKVGDMGRASLLTGCDCGRTLPMIASVMGRTSDLVRTPGGNRLTIHFFSSIFGHAVGVRNYQVRQESLDHLEIDVVLQAPEHADQLTLLKQAVLEHGDPELTINMNVVPSIKQEASGKQKYIISAL